MNFLLVANNITSAAVIIACWWLAHQYARLNPPGRLIASFLAMLGISILTTLLARNVGFQIEWMIVASKAVLAVALTLIIIRRHKIAGD